MFRALMRSVLALEDGRHFIGESFGAPGTAVGEVCFNTSMTGYQEVLTDPSYRGQIVAMTAPQIGNYGINALDDESAAAARARLCDRGTVRHPEQLALDRRPHDYLRSGKSPASRASTPAR